MQPLRAGQRVPQHRLCWRARRHWQQRASVRELEHTCRECGTELLADASLAGIRSIFCTWPCSYTAGMPGSTLRVRMKKTGDRQCYQLESVCQLGRLPDRTWCAARRRASSCCRTMSSSTWISPPTSSRCCCRHACLCNSFPVVQMANVASTASTGLFVSIYGNDLQLVALEKNQPAPTLQRPVISSKCCGRCWASCAHCSRVSEDF